MQLFFVDDIKGAIITLNEQESKHCIKVMRRRRGDMIEVVDGKGNYYLAQISDDNLRQVRATIHQIVKNWRAKSFKIKLAVSLASHTDRFEWMCEKATEMGVNEIVPIIAERTEKKTLNTERVQKILISAIKQSGRSFLPVLSPPISLIHFLLNHEDNEGYDKFIAWCGADRQQLLSNAYRKGSDALLLIGPEGDFTPHEVEVAEKKGFRPVSLGSGRYRLETAALIACCIVNLLNGDM